MRDVLLFLKSNTLALVGLLILLLLVVAITIGPWITPYTPRN